MFTIIAKLTGKHFFFLLFNTLYYATVENDARGYNAFNVYCRELAPGTVSLTGDRAQGEVSKHCAKSKKTVV